MAHFRRSHRAVVQPGRLGGRPLQSEGGERTNQVDQQLTRMLAVGLNGHLRAGDHGHVWPRVEAGHGDSSGVKGWLRQPGGGFRPPGRVVRAGSERTPET